MLVDKEVISINTELGQGDFMNMSYLANGSNSEVYIATFENKQVIVKMLMKNVRNPRLALQEINLEHGILARLSHPNVVKILGAGEDPHKFIVLEYLSSGTLQELLHPQSDPRSVSIIQFSSFFNKKLSALPIPIDRCLSMARDIANALKYLHEDCGEEVTIIHRG